MKKLVACIGLLVLASPVAAAPGVSVGYTLQKVSGEDIYPLGGYVSVFGKHTPISFDCEVAYHHSFSIYQADVATVAVGARVNFKSSNASRPFLRGQIGIGANIENGYTAWLGQLGAGVDIKTGGPLGFRLGADVQAFREQQGAYDMSYGVRLSGGVTF